MRLLLGILALLLVSSACGAEGGAPGDNTGKDEPAPPVTVLVSGTAAGGQPAGRWTELADDAAVAAYAERFRGSLPGDLTEAAGSITVADDEVLVAQVVAVGCDVPPGASVEDGELVAAEVTAPLPECFAPVTTVALAAVPA